jgi:long-chain fatty acid transport protein
VLLTNRLPIQFKTYRGELMKRSIKIAVAAAIALSATSAFATNGDHLIGTGAKARGMGGVGIGMSHGAESALTNPALITSVGGTEISFGGTVFMPDVKTNTGGGSLSSAADLSVIPEVSIAQKASDNFYWGIGMFGTAGMGVDHRANTGTLGTTTGNYSMVTNLQLMQFAVPLAYTANGFSLGIAPVLQYGSLDINYRTDYMGGTGGNTRGVAQDFGFGYNVGAAYETNGLTVGASYKSAIDMKYKNQVSVAAADFGLSGFSDNLEQPAEIGIGTSYKMGGNTFAIDFKQIKWGSAKGYKDFNWENQNVIILGYQYGQDNWALRAGYNHAKSPIKESARPQINLFNLLGFPAIVENHYTVGGTYGFSKMTSLDLAYVYSPTATQSFAAGGGLSTNGVVETKHSQQAASVQLNFKF